MHFLLQQLFWLSLIVKVASHAQAHGDDKRQHPTQQLWKRQDSLRPHVGDVPYG